MPVTMEQLIAANHDTGLYDQVSPLVETYRNSGEVISNGEHFWLSEKVLLEGIEHARAAQEFWQERINYLKMAQSTHAIETSKAE